MTLLSLAEVRRRAAQMDAARRMGTQEDLPEPSSAVRTVEDRLVLREITMADALATLRGPRSSRSEAPLAGHAIAVPEVSEPARNKLGITDAEPLAHAERAFSDVRTFELRLAPVAGRFDVEHYRHIHARLLGDVYDAAGQTRDDPTQRDHSTFARAAFIESEGRRIFTHLAQDHFFRGLDASAFADKASTLGADLNALQPAIGGDPRTTRLFLEQLGAQAGHPLDFSRFTRNDSYQHFEASLHGGGKALRPLMLRALAAGQAMARQLSSAAPGRGLLEPALQAGKGLSAAASAYLREPQAQAVARHPELAVAFAAERRMRTAALELGALAPSVEQAVTVRIREHLAVLLHSEVDIHASDGILNAVRHDAATAQLDHAVRQVQAARGLEPQSPVGSPAGQGITLEQRDWLARFADDALRPRPAGSPAEAVALSRHSQARWIAAAIGAVDVPARHATFQAPALQGLYEDAHRERAAGLDAQGPASQAAELERIRDLAP